MKPKPIAKPVRKAEPAGPSVLPSPPEVNLPDGDPESRMSWLRDLVMACPTCNANLNPGAKVVFGVGNPDADVFFCGEAPGNDEEMKGEPFVGAAGQLLDKIISATGLTRDGVYIGNVMNWRPQHDQAFGNRPPTEEEMNFCLPVLKGPVGSCATKGHLGPWSNRRQCLGSTRSECQDGRCSRSMVGIRGCAPNGHLSPILSPPQSQHAGQTSSVGGFLARDGTFGNANFR